jgi:uncharacterized protein YbgA (DUF1722 family)
MLTKIKSAAEHVNVIVRIAGAFSSEVDAGSREEYASKL